MYFCTETWMNLKDIMLFGKAQTQGSIHFMVPLGKRTGKLGWYNQNICCMQRVNVD